MRLVVELTFCIINLSPLVDPGDSAAQVRCSYNADQLHLVHPTR